MPAFSADDLQLLHATNEVDIQPVRKDGTQARRKIIWIVVANDQAYIRSVRGPSGAWYKAAVSSGQALLHAGSHSWPVSLSVVTDAATNAAVSEALESKYGKGWRSSTDAMLRDEVLPATLRLDATG